MFIKNKSTSKKKSIAKLLITIKTFLTTNFFIKLTTIIKKNFNFLNVKKKTNGLIYFKKNYIFRYFKVFENIYINKKILFYERWTYYFKR